ncbi:hypothetical protein EU528_02565 [Candidatus Thorarchaeota archaeon]|nr:MAG: hypothetical protein EU528_02565 [Candidatus Thorarchaeota archaeon]
MSDDPVDIINQYLALVREKLPNSIADDVITELETYMLETASDLGDNGQITLESAKKVVAQFGAPREVAEEYRFSMLPETISEGDIPPEIKQEIIEEPDIAEPEKQIPKVQGVNPTTSYSMFFIKSLLLIIFWASLASIIPLVLTQYWFQGTLLIFIIIPVLCVTTLLLAQTFYLKRKKTLLWKRSYPDWSIFQTLVTLPENSMPEAGTKIIRLDIVISSIGALIFASTIFQGNHPFGYIIGIPAAILLIARIKLAIRKFDEDKDPYEKSKLEFGVNLSLLVLLDWSIFWVFTTYGSYYYYSFIYMMGPFIATFVVIFTPVLLFQLLVGTQNLWWKTEKPLIPELDVTTKEMDSPKRELKKSIPSNGLRMFVGITSRLFLFISIPFLVRLFLQPNTGRFDWEPLPSFVFIAVILTVIIVIGYCIGRVLMIHFYNSSTFIGSRTRVEAIIDLGISGALLAGIVAWSTSFRTISILQYLTSYTSEIFEVSYNLGSIVVGFYVTAILLAFTGLPVRIIGNILEFWSERKHIAAMRIQDSSIILFVSLALFASNTYIDYAVTGNAHMIIFFFTMYFLIAVYLTYQMVASGMKLEEISKRKEKSISEKSQRVHSMNKNATMAN